MDASCTIQDSIHVFNLVHKYVSSILGTYQIWRDFFMFFFRAVIHLLIRSKIYQYIAYQRMAGNQLKKFLPVQRYFSP